jgi:hypothetical protein
MANDSDCSVRAAINSYLYEPASSMQKNFTTPRFLAVSRRRFCLALAAVSSTGLIGCQAGETTSPKECQRMDKDKKDIVYFDVNLKSYLDRPIFDVYLNGRDIGVAGGHPHGGNGGLMTGVPVPLGLQVVTWRLDGPEGMPGNGDKVTAVNQPSLLRPDAKLKYLGVHIYPDNTVELVPEAFWPEASPRGDQINREWERTHGK